jgi:hypothetical protein
MATSHSATVSSYMSPGILTCDGFLFSYTYNSYNNKKNTSQDGSWL